MKHFRLLFVSLLMIVGSMTTGAWAEGINIPTEEGSTLNPNDATITKIGGTSAKVSTAADGTPYFNNFRNGDYATFDINNTVAQRYFITFEASTNRPDANIQLVIEPKNDDEEALTTIYDGSVTIVRGDFDTYNEYTVATTSLPAGELTFKLVFNSSGTAYSANIKNISFEAYDEAKDPTLGQIIPGAIDVTKGTFDGGGTKNVSVGESTLVTLDNFRDGKNVTYDINNTKDGIYTVAFNAACNADNVSLTFLFTDADEKEVATVDIPVANNKSWSDFSPLYTFAIPLDKGIYKLKLIFHGAKANATTTNLANLTFTKNAGKIVLPAVGYASFSATRAIDFTNVSGVEAYIATSKSAATVTLEKVTKVPANTGLILKGEGTAYLPVVESADAIDGTNYLVAVSAAQTVSGDGKYVLGDKDGEISFFSVGSDGTEVSGGSAYLDLGTSSGAKILKIVFGGETTDINRVTTSVPDIADNVYYTMTGVRVDKPAKGLYILNGKKVIIK